MSKIMRAFLVIITIFVLGRFLLEIAGVSDSVTSEISLTRLLFVLPVILGLHLGNRKTASIREVLQPTLIYVSWGIGLVMLVTAVATAGGLGTHYAHGALGPHLLGHLVEWVVLIVICSLITAVTVWIYRRV